MESKYTKKENRKIQKKINMENIYKEKDVYKKRLI